MGGIVAEMSFDAFGKRRNVLTLAELAEAQYDVLNAITTKGFTGHEMVDEVGIIHMGGRIYDPELGRFMSADPIISDMTNVQRLNRYSYVLNSPLSYVDPSGFDGCKSGPDVTGGCEGGFIDISAWYWTAPITPDDTHIKRSDQCQTAALLKACSSGSGPQGPGSTTADTETTQGGNVVIPPAEVVPGTKPEPPADTTPPPADTTANGGSSGEGTPPRPPPPPPPPAPPPPPVDPEPLVLDTDVTSGGGSPSPTVFGTFDAIATDLLPGYQLGKCIFGSACSAGEWAWGIIGAIPYGGAAVGSAGRLGRLLVAKSGKQFEVLTESAISGTSRSAHRTSANKALAEQLRADPDFAAGMNKQLGTDVLKHMESGKSGLRNPPSTEWHHPKGSSGGMWLLRRGTHRDPGLQDYLHQGGTGGFRDYYRQ
ncbi:MAG: RHS repeat-associated core domain-containing protein [Gammaproteobacteria bacterium]|nr:RHS repeat-associated core domain-containing protein [Gammaproteobacteria bacterium]